VGAFPKSILKQVLIDVSTILEQKQATVSSVLEQICLKVSCVLRNQLEFRKYFHAKK